MQARAENEDSRRMHVAAASCPSLRSCPITHIASIPGQAKFALRCVELSAQRGEGAPGASSSADKGEAVRSSGAYGEQRLDADT
jgi:hypothetical protein